MIGVSRQAVIYYSQISDHILPKVRFGKGRTVGQRRWKFYHSFYRLFCADRPGRQRPYFSGHHITFTKRRKIRLAIEGSTVAVAIVLFFALCGAWILQYLAVSLTAFKLAGGIILRLVALDMLSNRWQNVKTKKQ